MKRIKNLFKYYSDMLSSINYHNKSTSQKMTKELNKIEEIANGLENFNVKLEKNMDFVNKINNNLEDLKQYTFEVNKRDIVINDNISIKVMIPSTNIESIKNKSKYELIVNNPFYVGADYLLIPVNLGNEKIEIIIDDVLEETFFMLDHFNLFSKSNFIEYANLIQEKGYLLIRNSFASFDQEEILENIYEKKKFRLKKYVTKKYIEGYGLSFIVPVFNAADYVEETIEALLSQKLDDNATEYEIILIDDFSTDNSYDVLSKYKKYEFIRVYRNEQNIGLGLTRNRGIELAQYPYVMFIDSDDKISNDLFFAYNSILNKYKGVEVIAFEMLIWELNKVVNVNQSRKYNDLRLKIADYDVIINDTSACTKIFKKSLFDIKKFEKGYYEDSWLTTFLYDKFVILSTNGKYYYRKHEQESITNNKQILEEKFVDVQNVFIDTYLEIVRKKIDFDNAFNILKKMHDRIRIVQGQYMDYSKIGYKELYKRNFANLKKVLYILNIYKIENNDLKILKGIEDASDIEEVLNQIYLNNVYFNEGKFYVNVGYKKIYVDDYFVYFCVKNGKNILVYLKVAIDYEVVGWPYDIVNNQKIYCIRLDQRKTVSIFIQNNKGKYERKDFNIQHRKV